MGHLNPSRIDKVNMRLVQVVLIIAIPLFALLADVHRRSRHRALDFAALADGRACGMVHF